MKGKDPFELDKNKVSDIYSKVKVDGLNMYEQRSHRVMMRYRLNKQVIDRKIIQIRFLLGFGGLIDIFYIRAAILKKSLLKKQFVLEIEHNLECYIPGELSCDQYPASFQFYDPII